MKTILLILCCAFILHAQKMNEKEAKQLIYQSRVALDKTNYLDFSPYNKDIFEHSMSNIDELITLINVVTDMKQGSTDKAIVDKWKSRLCEAIRVDLIVFKTYIETTEAGRFKAHLEESDYLITKANTGYCKTK